MNNNICKVLCARKSPGSRHWLSMAAVIGQMVGPVAAAQDAHRQLEEVIVTAQKRSENVQSIPSTVNAIQGDEIEDLKLFSFKDLEKLAPGLSLTEPDSRRRTISLRGITFDPDSNAASAVDVYWNGQVVAAGDVFQQLFDLERVEVLRGPQGTLQGRTSPGGAIQLHTRRPNMQQFEGYAEQSFTDQKGSNTQLAVSIPIVPGQLAARLAGLYDENNAGGVKNITTGQEQTALSRAGRFTLDWTPTDTFEAILVHEYLESQRDTAIPIEGKDLLGQGKPSLDTYDRKALSNLDGSIQNRINLTALNLSWSILGHELTSVSGYRKTGSGTLTDTDPAQTTVFTQYQTVDSTQEQFTQEVRLSSVASETWEYIVGLYYDKEMQHTDYVLFANNAPVAAVDIPNRFERFGVFAHNKIHFGPKTSLQLGVRWNRQRRNNRSDILNPMTGQVLFGQITNENQSDTSEAITGTLSLSHNPTDDFMLYATYASSHRPSGAVITPTFGLEPNLYVFGEEDSQSIEIGFKATLADGRTRLNGSIYYQSFNDFISRVDDVFADTFNPRNPPSAGGPIPGDGIADVRVQGGLTYNGDAIIQGAELELNSVLTERLTIGGSLSYVDARYDDAVIPCNVAGPGGQFIIPEGPGNPGAVAYCNADGRRIGTEPSWSGSLDGEYVVPLGSTEMYLRGLFKYTGSRDNPLLPDGQVGGYSVFNMYLGLRLKEQWDVSAWAANLFDKQARSGQEPLITQGPALTGYRGVRIIPERTVGVTGRYRF